MMSPSDGDRLEALHDDLAAARAEIARLREIVDRLPKTADGVPITPGASVWTIVHGRACEWRCWDFYAYDFKGKCREWHINAANANFRATECWGSEAAAEAAEAARRPSP